MLSENADTNLKADHSCCLHILSAPCRDRHTTWNRIQKWDRGTEQVCRNGVSVLHDWGSLTGGTIGKTMASPNSCTRPSHPLSSPEKKTCNPLLTFIPVCREGISFSWSLRGMRGPTRKDQEGYKIKPTVT